MRTIHMTVDGDNVSLDSAVAGVQGSGNVDKIVVRFDPSWAGYAKTACWWDAHGEKAGEPQTLTVNELQLKADVDDPDFGYILLVPPKALVYAGRCSLVIDGWKDGCLARTARQEFRVVAAPPPAEGAKIDATEAQRLQAEIEALMGNMAALAHSEHAQAAARVRFLQSVWETGERDWGYTSGYEPADDGSGETIFYFPFDDRPMGGIRWRKHPIEGGEYKVTVTRGEKTTVQSVYYADVPIQVDGVTVWGDSKNWPLPGVDALKIEYVRYMDDQKFSAKEHLEKLCADAQVAKEEAQRAKMGAQTEKEAAEKAADRAQEAARHGPYVGENGNWMVWDLAADTYQDSGIYAGGTQGERGETGPAGPQGLQGEPGRDGVDGRDGALLDPGPGVWVVGVNGKGELVVTVDPGQDPPLLSLDQGFLLYHMNG